MVQKNEKAGRTRQPRSVRESDIITAAYGVFSEKGYEKAAMSEIAKLSGVAEGTIYKYFANKQDLLARVIASFYKKLIASAESSLEGITGVENQIRVLISRHIQIFFEDRGMCRLLLQEVRPLNDYPHSEMHKLTRQYSEILLSVIQQAIDRGELMEGVSPQTIRDMIFGCLEHTAWNVLASKKSSFNKEQLTNEIITITMNGLLPIQNKQEGFDHHLARLEKLVNRMEQS